MELKALHEMTLHCSACHVIYWTSISSVPAMQKHPVASGDDILLAGGDPLNPFDTVASGGDILLSQFCCLY